MLEDAWDLLQHHLRLRYYLHRLAPGSQELPSDWPDCCGSLHSPRQCSAEEYVYVGLDMGSTAVMAMGLVDMAVD